MGGRTRDEKMGKMPNVHALWAEMDRLEIILRPKRLKKKGRQPTCYSPFTVGGEEEEGMHRAISSLGRSYQYNFVCLKTHLCQITIFPSKNEQTVLPARIFPDYTFLGIH